MFLKSAKQQKGQGMVEYALILVLVAVVVIGALTIMGPQVKAVFDSVNSHLTSAPTTCAAAQAAHSQWHTDHAGLPDEYGPGHNAVVNAEITACNSGG